MDIEKGNTNGEATNIEQVEFKPEVPVPPRTVTRTLKGTGTMTLLLCEGTSQDGRLCTKIARHKSSYCKYHTPGKFVPVKYRTEEKLSAETFVLQYAVTLDPHDKKHPIKSFPKYDFIKEIIKQWLENDLMLVVKSRQMMASWLFVALHLWDAMVHEGRTVFFISKKEEDAGFGNDLSLLSRARFILEHLPAEIKPNFKIDHRPPSISFPGRYSSLMAVSQDAEALRQYTASRILSDEMAFQERAEKAYTAMKPTIDSGGAFTGISTPNGRHNLFYHLVHDIQQSSKADNESVGLVRKSENVRNQESICKGLSSRKNKNGFTVLSLHRSANPARGEDWASKMKPTYASVDAWNQEQELDFTKTEGARVYPGFRADRHVRLLKYNPWRTIWRGWDFGYNHPAVVWVQIDEFDRVCVLKELLGEEVVINVFAREVLKRSEEWFPGCSF